MDWSQKLINLFVSETTESACICICIRITIVIEIIVIMQQKLLEALKFASVWSSIAFVTYHLFLSFLNVCPRSWQYILYLALGDLVFLLSMLFPAWFLLLTSSFSSVLFLSNKSSCFLTVVLSIFLDILYTIDLKTFHFL